MFPSFHGHVCSDRGGMVSTSVLIPCLRVFLEEWQGLGLLPAWCLPLTMVSLRRSWPDAPLPLVMASSLGKC